jgi:hypothetical protein
MEPKCGNYPVCSPIFSLWRKCTYPSPTMARLHHLSYATRISGERITSGEGVTHSSKPKVGAYKIPFLPIFSSNFLISFKSKSRCFIFFSSFSSAEEFILNPLSLKSSSDTNRKAFPTHSGPTYSLSASLPLSRTSLAVSRVPPF